MVASSKWCKVTFQTQKGAKVSPILVEPRRIGVVQLRELVEENLVRRRLVWERPGRHDIVVAVASVQKFYFTRIGSVSVARTGLSKSMQVDVKASSMDTNAHNSPESLVEFRNAL